MKRSETGLFQIHYGWYKKFSLTKVTSVIFWKSSENKVSCFKTNRMRSPFTYSMAEDSYVQSWFFFSELKQREKLKQKIRTNLWNYVTSLRKKKKPLFRSNGKKSKITRHIEISRYELLDCWFAVNDF